MANNLSAFTPTKFSLKLIDLLYNKTIYPTITNTDYEGEIKEAGDRVRVRTSAKITMNDYTKGMTLVKQDLNPTMEDLIVDQQKYFSFGVDDVDAIQNDIDAISKYADNAKNDMAEVVDSNILSYGVKNVEFGNMLGTNYSAGTAAVAASTGVVTGTSTTFTAAMVGGIFKHNASATSFLVTAYTSATSITIKDLDGVAYTGGVLAGGAYAIWGATALAVDSTNVYSKLVDLKTVLGKSKCPKAGRFIVVNSEFEGVLSKASQFIPAVQTAYNDVVKEGLIGKIAGFEVITTELVPGDNTTGYFFLAGTKEYLSLAMQIMKTSVIPSESDPNSFTATCKGLLVWGRKVFQVSRAKGAVLRATLS